MQARPYQKEALDRIHAAFEEFKRILAVLPTGSGKTILFAWLAQSMLPGRTLILAHREELIDQAIEKIHTVTGIWSDKEKAEHRASLGSCFVVASVQSMVRRLEQWPPDHFNLVVADEAHHAISESWKKVLTHFKSRVLGVTATPDRGDKRTLSEFFEAVAIDVNLVDLIKDGFLCPITIKSLPLQIDLNDVGILAGDFASEGLGSALEPYLEQIAQAIKEHASFRKVLAFLPLIDTSRKFVEACRKVGLHARHVDGTSENRKEILQDFSADSFDVLSNAMLLTEGYDDPSIDCVIVLRPTKSRPLFAQMVGRGTRIHPTKENLLLLDFLWMHERHRIIHAGDLVAQDTEEADIINRLTQEKTAAGAGEEELDLMNLASSATEEREEKLREELAKAAARKSQFITAEEFCLEHGNHQGVFYQPTMKWESAKVTRKQMKYLEKTKIDPDTIQGRGHASMLLEMIFKSKDLELAPHKQRWVMAQAGHPNAWLATSAEARRFFAQRHKNKTP